MVKGIGLLGFGSVGTGVLDLIEGHMSGGAAVRRVGVRDLAKPRKRSFEGMTTDLASIVDDPEVHVVIEVMGGIDPALFLIERAIDLGKPVITANKELLAKHWHRLHDLGGELRYEAAAAAAIPIVQTLDTLRQTNKISEIEGILNGTTNFILSGMAERGTSFDDMLVEAQRLGYAEADPSSDVDGFDAGYKIAILSAMASGKAPDIAAMSISGIRGVSPEKIREAHRKGEVLKLVAHWSPDEGASVGVRSLPLGNPLSSVSGTMNAVKLMGDFCGPLTLVGRGAGSWPTASAVCGDLAQILAGQ